MTPLFLKIFSFLLLGCHVLLLLKYWEQCSRTLCCLQVLCSGQCYYIALIPFSFIISLWKNFPIFANFTNETRYSSTPIASFQFSFCSNFALFTFTFNYASFLVFHISVYDQWPRSEDIQQERYWSMALTLPSLSLHHPPATTSWELLFKLILKAGYSFPTFLPDFRPPSNPTWTTQQPLYSTWSLDSPCFC